jgi:Ni2+-binding GTPase involved in regulation of expression and maturation of urease and hydrogenase
VKFVTVAGPPSSGKTAVLIHTIKRLLEDDIRVAVGKIDCVETDDGEKYKKLGIPVVVGLSGDLCPDHYYVSNLEEILTWAKECHAGIAIMETAGLCHRCAPAIAGCLSIAVIDNLSGIDTPKKIGPVLSTADVVVITKGDVVSQAEREVFRQKVEMVNPKAEILEFNGLTGKGSIQLKRIIIETTEVDTLANKDLRSSMPACICSYCTGETRIGSSFQLGHVLKIESLERKEAS